MLSRRAERPARDLAPDANAVPDAVGWDRIVAIAYAGRAPVYDIEVEGTHNFVANGILAHNTSLGTEVPGFERTGSLATPPTEHPTVPSDPDEPGQADRKGQLLEGLRDFMEAERVRPGVTMTAKQFADHVRAKGQRHMSIHIARNELGGLVELGLLERAEGRCTLAAWLREAVSRSPPDQPVEARLDPLSPAYIPTLEPLRMWRLPSAWQRTTHPVAKARYAAAQEAAAVLRARLHPSPASDLPEPELEAILQADVSLREFRSLLSGLLDLYGSVERMRGLTGLEFGPRNQFALLEWTRAHGMEVEGVGREMGSHPTLGPYLHPVSEYNEVIEHLQPESLDFVVARLSLYPYDMISLDDPVRLMIGVEDTLKWIKAQTRWEALRRRYGPLVRALKPGGVILSTVYTFETDESPTAEELTRLGLEVARPAVSSIEEATEVVTLGLRRRQGPRPELPPPIEDPPLSYIRLTPEGEQVIILTLSEALARLKSGTGFAVMKIGGRWMESVNTKEIESLIWGGPPEERPTGARLEELFWRTSYITEGLLRQPQIHPVEAQRLVDTVALLPPIMEREGHADADGHRQRQIERLRQFLQMPGPSRELPSSAAFSPTVGAGADIALKQLTLTTGGSGMTVQQVVEQALQLVTGVEPSMCVVLVSPTSSIRELSVAFSGVLIDVPYETWKMERLYEGDRVLVIPRRPGQPHLQVTLVPDSLEWQRVLAFPTAELPQTVAMPVTIRPPLASTHHAQVWLWVPRHGLSVKELLTALSQMPAATDLRNHLYDQANRLFPWFVVRVNGQETHDTAATWVTPQAQVEIEPAVEGTRDDILMAEGWRAFIPGGIHTQPAWRADPEYHAVQESQLYDSALGVQEWLEESEEFLNARGIHLAGRVGQSLVLGFGEHPEELPFVRDRFGAKTVHGMDWDAWMVQRAALYYWARGYSPGQFVVHHADWRALDDDMAGSMDLVVVQGNEIAQFNLSHAESIVRALVPGGVAMIREPFKDPSPFITYLRRHGTILNDERSYESGIIFQKISSTSVPSPTRLGEPGASRERAEEPLDHLSGRRRSIDEAERRP